MKTAEEEFKKIDDFLKNIDIHVQKIKNGLAHIMIKHITKEVGHWPTESHFIWQFYEDSPARYVLIYHGQPIVIVFAPEITPSVVFLQGGVEVFAELHPDCPTIYKELYKGKLNEKDRLTKKDEETSA